MGKWIFSINFRQWIIANETGVEMTKASKSYKAADFCLADKGFS